MKGIKCCGECAYYNMKKHKCTGGAEYSGKAEDSFYTDCPHVEAEPVRHGRWIEDGEICGIDKYKCSLCGGEVGGLLDNTKYCCFCGAKMDGGDNNG